MRKNKPINSKADNNNSSDDEGFTEIVTKALQDGGSSNYAKGDKIRVTKGDLIGLAGVIEMIDDTQIFFKPI